MTINATILDVILLVFCVLLLAFNEYIFRVIQKEDPLFWTDIGQPSITTNQYHNLLKIYKSWGVVFSNTYSKNNKIKNLLNILRYLTIIYFIFFGLVVAFNIR